MIVEPGEVADADRAAADLVLVGGADAAPRGADLARARGVLAQRVEVAVDREDQRAGLGDHQHLGRHLDAHLAHPLDLGLERPRVEHHAVADHRGRAANDARRKERELVGLVADDERMAGVVAALEAHDHVGAARQPVDDLALAFVAPLGADDGDVAHVRSLLLAARAALGEGMRASSFGCSLKSSVARPGALQAAHAAAVTRRR